MRRVLLAYEPPDGGVAENVAQLALGLSAHGWQPTVVGPLESTIYERFEGAPIDVFRLPFSRGFGEPIEDARGLRGLRRMIAAGNFDLVHAHSSKAGALARAAARGRLPTVYTPHCFAFVGDVGRAQRTISITTERLLARWTSAIVCVCEDERQRALQAGIGSAELLHLVRNGVDPFPPETEPDPELTELRQGGPVVAAIAVLRRQKRLDLLIDAAPAILAAVPEARVVIVGSGPEGENLTAHAASLGLDSDPRFRMVPFQGPSWRYLAALDLLVLPSEWEAFPIGLLEALAAGVPQVATDVGGNGEAVFDGTTGLLVAPDAAQIAAATIDLLGDPDRRAAMSLASRQRRDEDFTIERMVAATAAVYDEVAGPASHA